MECSVVRCLTVLAFLIEYHSGVPIKAVVWVQRVNNDIKSVVRVGRDQSPIEFGSKLDNVLPRFHFQFPLRLRYQVFDHNRTIVIIVLAKCFQNRRQQLLPRPTKTNSRWRNSIQIG